MVWNPGIENQRLKLQASLDSGKSQGARNKLGQFATPSLLAKDILDYATTLLNKEEAIRFLDPAIGTGSFYSALLQAFPKNRVTHAAGYEIDPHYGEPAQKLWEGFPLKIYMQDFTTAPSPHPAERFNLVICNPPYVRHHHIGQSHKEKIRELVKNTRNIQLSGLAGLYCYFLTLSHTWMSKGGLAGWLIPSEFMDVNYGSAIKEYLLKEVTLLRIHRFDPNEVQFDDALVSSAIVWFKNEKPPQEHEVMFSYGGTLSAPDVTQKIKTGILQRSPKWTQLNQSRKRPISLAPKVDDLFTIKRGIATGDNKFFILPRNEIEEKGLPINLFRPILPNPRYISSNEVHTDINGNPALERQLFVLDCRLPESTIEEEYPALWTYLQSGLSSVANRYLCKSRAVWYYQEQRQPAPFLCTYMGRSNSEGKSPFRFLLNHSKAIAGNTYLMLYPKRALANLLERKPDTANDILDFLNSIPPEDMVSQGRVYGGGLYKLEPKELANVAIDTLAEYMPVENGANQLALFGAA